MEASGDWEGRRTDRRFSCVLGEEKSEKMVQRLSMRHDPDVCVSVCV